MKLSAEEFNAVVEEALDSLPEQFAALLENIAVVVEEEPTDEDLELLDDDEEYECDDPECDGEHTDELLGIYRGTPKTERTWDMALLPDQVAIFRGPILRVARNRREAVEEIRETVIHELGHYFGLSDDEMVF